MKKEEIIKELAVLTEAVQNAKERLDALQRENEALRELVHHLASRPAPYQPKDPYGPPFVVTC
jgi:FtsZ-binding cell division protein ZapB